MSACRVTDVGPVLAGQPPKPPTPMAMPPKRASGLLRAVGTHSNEVEVEVEHDEVENRSPLAA